MCNDYILPLGGTKCQHNVVLFGSIRQLKLGQSYSSTGDISRSFKQSSSNLISRINQSFLHFCSLQTCHIGKNRMLPHAVGNFYSHWPIR